MIFISSNHPTFIYSHMSAGPNLSFSNCITGTSGGIPTCDSKFNNTCASSRLYDTSIQPTEPFPQFPGIEQTLLPSKVKRLFNIWYPEHSLAPLRKPLPSVTRILTPVQKQLEHSIHARWMRAAPDCLIASLGGEAKVNELPIIPFDRSYQGIDYIDRLPVSAVTATIMIGIDMGGRAFLVFRFNNRNNIRVAAECEVVHARYNDFSPEKEKHEKWVGGGKLLSRRWSPLNVEAWSYIDDLINHRPCGVPVYINEEWKDQAKVDSYGRSIIELV